MTIFVALYGDRYLCAFSKLRNAVELIRERGGGYIVALDASHFLRMN